MSDRLKIALFILAVLVLAGITGSSDFEEEQREEQSYCEQVSVGHIPAYRDDIDCRSAR